MEFGQNKIFREIDLFDFTSFLARNFINILARAYAIIFKFFLELFRTSIHSLVFRSTGYKDSIGANYIPPNRFNTITVVVVVITLIVGIMIPDIEFVLGLVGATIGNAVCILLPSVIFVHLTSR